MFNIKEIQSSLLFLIKIMKITGRRLLHQMLGWDFGDYCASAHLLPKNSKNRKWSKIVRNRLKNNFLKDIDEEN